MMVHDARRVQNAVRQQLRTFRRVHGIREQTPQTEPTLIRFRSAVQCAIQQRTIRTAATRSGRPQVLQFGAQRLQMKGIAVTGSRQRSLFGGRNLEHRRIGKAIATDALVFPDGRNAGIRVRRGCQSLLLLRDFQPVENVGGHQIALLLRSRGPVEFLGDLTATYARRLWFYNVNGCF